MNELCGRNGANLNVCSYKRYAVVMIGLLFMFAANAVFAHSGTSLEVVIQNLEKTASSRNTSALERHEALVRLARLREMTGDIEGAARNWLDAAGAIPGKIDDDALLSCAFCLAAMGEWDRARTALEPLLLKSPRANFLNISINALNTGNTSTLAAIAENPDYSSMKNEIYFLLWKINSRFNPDSASAIMWRQRLAAEFPQSPEGRLASDGRNVFAVNPSPFWLLLGGLDSLPVTESAAALLPSSAQTAPVNLPQAPIQQAASVNNSSQTSVSLTRLQTGLFSRQANAQAQMEALKQAGFSPSLEQRNDLWVVTVPSGQDTNSTIASLRNAGFESFPVR